MGLKDTRIAKRLSSAMRSYFIGGLSMQSHDGWLGSSRPVSSGVLVNESTALHYSAFFSGVNLISSQLATPPLFLLRRDEDIGKTRFPVSNPLYRLIHDRPNPEMSSFEWRKVMQAHALTWMGGFSEIERDGSGRAVALWPLVPGRVRTYRASPDSDLQYVVMNPSGHDALIDRMNMIHIKGLSLDGINGLNMVHQMSESLGLGIAAERFGAEFYGNGASFGGVISYPGDATELAKKNNRDTLAARHQGVENAHKLLALYGGAQYQSIGIAPNLAQFLETRQFQVTEVARWLNIPPHKLGDLTRSTNNNIEQQDIDFYKTTMLPWFTSWEQELWFKLVPRLEQNIQIIEFFVDGLLRGDVTARGEFYSKQSLAGAITPNEIRAAENRNKISGGDISLVPLNTIPLHLISDYYQAEIDSRKAAVTAALRPAHEPTPTEPHVPKRELDQAIEERDRARVLAQQAEDARDIARAELEAVTAERLRQDAALVAADAEKARLTEQATSLGTDLSRAVADLTAATDLALAADQRATTAEGALTTARVDATVATGYLETVEARLADEQAERVLAIAAHEQERSTLLAERAAFQIRCEAADASIAELRLGTAMHERAGTELLTHVAEAKQAAGLSDARAMAAEAAQTATTAALEREQQARQQAVERLEAVSVELRAVLVDAINRLITRETDRARKAQQSPDKLRKWLETFYPAHDDVCRSALRPALRALAAASGHNEPIEHLIESLVAQHIDQSVRQLRAVADEHDTESLAPALEKLLRRWEADRADTFADRVVREAA